MTTRKYLVLKYTCSVKVMLALLVILHQALSQVCLHHYLSQPPSELMCNPFAFEAELVLQCSASVSIPSGSEAGIQWFYDNQKITVSSFSPLRNISAEGSVGRTIISTATFNFSGDDSFKGDYYCQIVVDGNYANPSGILTLAPEVDYIRKFFDPCLPMRVQFVRVSNCAGPTSSPPPAPSASPTTTKSASLMDSTLLTTSLPTLPSTTDSSFTTIGSSAVGGGLQFWIYIFFVMVAVFGVIIVAMSGALCFCYKTRITGTEQNTDPIYEDVGEGIRTGAAFCEMDTKIEMKHNMVYGITDQAAGCKTDSEITMNKNQVYGIPGIGGEDTGYENVMSDSNVLYLTDTPIGIVHGSPQTAGPCETDLDLQIEMKKNQVYGVAGIGDDETGYENVVSDFNVLCLTDTQTGVTASETTL